MTTTLFNRGNGVDTGRGWGLLILTRASNGLGKGSRLELYASTHDNCPIEIHDRAEARELASALLSWAGRGWSCILDPECAPGCCSEPDACMPSPVEAGDADSQTYGEGEATA